MAFDFGVWSDGAIKLLLVREEAHRYVWSSEPGISADPKGISGSPRKGANTVFFLPS